MTICELTAAEAFHKGFNDGISDSTVVYCPYAVEEYAMWWLNGTSAAWGVKMANKNVHFNYDEQ